MYVDVHAHAFHVKIAEKAVKQLANHYKMLPSGSGLVEELLEREKKAGIDKVFVLCAATTENQVIPANDFALSLKKVAPEVLEVFGTIHPFYDDWEKELGLLKEAGVKGIKLHPDFQGFFLNEPKLLPILEHIGQDMVIMCHIGDVLEPENNPSCPYKLYELIKMFPHITFIAAHLGGYLHWEHALNTYIGKEVYIDTCSSLSIMPVDLLKIILKKHPREYILFGSDYPLFDPVAEVENLSKIAKLKEDEIDQILSNGAKLF